MTLSDLICVMRDGKIIQAGSQSEIYTKPRNIYVAEFVGKPRMSLVKGALEHGADGVTFVGQGLRIDLGPAAELQLSNAAAPAVVLGVRAEDVIVSTDSDASGFAATVGLTEPIGSDTFVELEAGEAVELGHAEVQQHDVGGGLADRRDDMAADRDLVDDLEVLRVGERAPNRGLHQPVVVRNQYAALHTVRDSRAGGHKQ